MVAHWFQHVQQACTFEDDVILGTVVGQHHWAFVRPAGERVIAQRDENMHVVTIAGEPQVAFATCVRPWFLWEAGERIRQLFAVETGELEDA